MDVTTQTITEDVLSEASVKKAAKTAVADYQNADAETKAAFLHAIAQELGVDVSVESRPQLQAALLDSIHDTIGNKPLLNRANFARAVIAVLDMDARMVISSDRRHRRNIM